MQFVMIKDFSWDLSKDKVIIGKLKDNTTITLAYLLVIAEFDKDYEYNIIYNHQSVQIRPKAIYRNDKGYYKKIDGKRIYCNEKEVREIVLAINKFRKYLNGIQEEI